MEKKKKEIEEVPLRTVNLMVTGTRILFNTFFLSVVIKQVDVQSLHVCYHCYHSRKVIK